MQPEHSTDMAILVKYDGEAGVDVMLEIMHNEFRRCMQLTGCRTVKDINKACLARINADGTLKRLELA